MACGTNSIDLVEAQLQNYESWRIDQFDESDKEVDEWKSNFLTWPAEGEENLSVQHAEVDNEHLQIC